MFGDLVLVDEEACCVIFAPLALYLYTLISLIFLTTSDGPILKAVKEFIGFGAIFGSIYWYTLDPTTKRAIKLAALSTDIKLTEHGLAYKPFQGIPLSLVITSRDGKPAIGIRVWGGADSYRVHNPTRGKIDV